MLRQLCKTGNGRLQGTFRDMTEKRRNITGDLKFSLRFWTKIYATKVSIVVNSVERSATVVKLYLENFVQSIFNSFLCWYKSSVNSKGECFMNQLPPLHSLHRLSALCIK